MTEWGCPVLTLTEEGRYTAQVFLGPTRYYLCVDEDCLCGVAHWVIWGGPAPVRDIPPDAHCVTLPDGACVGEGCMHDG